MDTKELLGKLKRAAELYVRWTEADESSPPTDHDQEAGAAYQQLRREVLAELDPLLTEAVRAGMVAIIGVDPDSAVLATGTASNTEMLALVYDAAKGGK